jgi:hypothetical protein
MEKGWAKVCRAAAEGMAGWGFLMKGYYFLSMGKSEHKCAEERQFVSQQQPPARVIGSLGMKMDSHCPLSRVLLRIPCTVGPVSSSGKPGADLWRRVTASEPCILAGPTIRPGDGLHGPSQLDHS